MPEEDGAEVVAEAEEPTVPVGRSTCRHCGQPFDGEVPEDGDFLCAACDHYQDHMQCPTCGSQVRISLMPADLHPEIHTPARRKKEK